MESPGALPSRGLVFQLICRFQRYWAYSSKSTVQPTMESCFQDRTCSVSSFRLTCTHSLDWIITDRAVFILSLFFFGWSILMRIPDIFVILPLNTLVCQKYNSYFHTIVPLSYLMKLTMVLWYQLTLVHSWICLVYFCYCLVCKAQHLVVISLKSFPALLQTHGL